MYWVIPKPKHPEPVCQNIHSSFGSRHTTLQDFYRLGKIVWVSSVVKEVFALMRSRCVCGIWSTGCVSACAVRSLGTAGRDDVCWKRNEKCFACFDAVHGQTGKGASEPALIPGCVGAPALEPCGGGRGDSSHGDGCEAGCSSTLLARRGSCFDPVEGKKEFWRLWQICVQRHFLKAE